MLKTFREKFIFHDIFTTKFLKQCSIILVVVCLWNLRPQRDESWPQLTCSVVVRARKDAPGSLMPRDHKTNVSLGTIQACRQQFLIFCSRDILSTSTCNRERNNCGGDVPLRHKPDEFVAALAAYTRCETTSDVVTESPLALINPRRLQLVDQTTWHDLAHLLQGRHARFHVQDRRVLTSVSPLHRHDWFLPELCPQSRIRHPAGTQADVRPP